MRSLCEYYDLYGPTRNFRVRDLRPNPTTTSTQIDSKFGTFGQPAHASLCAHVLLIGRVEVGQLPAGVLEAEIKNHVVKLLQVFSVADTEKDEGLFATSPVSVLISASMGFASHFLTLHG